jgi:hypothetical protein
MYKTLVTKALSYTRQGVYLDAEKASLRHLVLCPAEQVPLPPRRGGVPVGGEGKGGTISLVELGGHHNAVCMPIFINRLIEAHLDNLCLIEYVDTVYTPLPRLQASIGRSGASGILTSLPMAA